MSEALPLLAIAVVSAVATALARAYALRGRLLDLPGARRSHAVATPRGGGVGPVVGIALTLAWMASDVAAHEAFVLPLAGFLAVAAVGFWDDHRPLPASLRLAVHAAAAVSMAWGLFDPAQDTWRFAVAVALGVVLVNVWNFMDGIDGIATSQAMLCGLAAALVLAPAFGFVALAIAAAAAAFLPFNFPRARIFLGDVGSGALGLVIAYVIAAALLQSEVDALRLAFPLSAFVIDAGLTLGRRMLRGERWWEPHTQHLYQALARRHGHVRVTVAYAAWTAAAAGLGVLLRGDLRFILLSVTMWYTTGAALWFLLQGKLQPDAARTLEKDR